MKPMTREYRNGPSPSSHEMLDLYGRHVQAMTKECLHLKSEIASE